MAGRGRIRAADIALLATHFVLPFVLLLGRAPKRSRGLLVATSALVLLAHAFLTVTTANAGAKRGLPARSRT
mgnify:CR=1 FL=1